MSSQAIQLKITLRGIEPPIWRRLQVPGSMSLAALHETIQTSMGWLDYHLHLFEAGGVIYRSAEDLDSASASTDVDLAAAALDQDEEETAVAEVARAGSSFRYEYDFGDCWRHEVLVEQVRTVRTRISPVCLAGARAAPPEDCGGPSGYLHLLDVLADVSHPDHARMVDHYGGDLDPEYFDLDAVNEMLAL